MPFILLQHYNALENSNEGNYVIKRQGKHQTSLELEHDSNHDDDEMTLDDYKIDKGD